MSLRGSRALLLVIIIISIVFAASMQSSAALRLLKEEPSGVRNLDAGMSLYVQAKEVMALWMERLPSGPSPGGGGN
ncbi:hypothetical protein IEQ34_003586 [Dendrobium chrysotoxum]|uniref:Uncharacterized protein n=1 Tax=Dendrobium chrysotoxum TaxID=161865 RepID=A0AAV7HKD5_DENCH|nr:hypothetical protein IEQ34_003586 [Dendrobium chrysotoxum]